MRVRGETWQAAVLDILTKRAGPLSAYDVLEGLRDLNSKVAPTTVYRALTALTEQGKVHKLESLNAFVACACTSHSDAAILSICDDCGTVEESLEPEIVSKLTNVLGKSGFEAQRHVIEVHGTCATCSEDQITT